MNILRETGGKLDPYKKIKRKDIQANLNYFEKSLDEFSGAKSKLTNELLLENLLGNQSDLSQFKSLEQSKIKLLRDDRNEFLSFLEYDQTKNVNIICDNAGIELFNDIILAINLIEEWNIECINLHVKKIPIFVSDAIHNDEESDINDIIELIKKLNIDTYNKIMNLESYNRINWVVNDFWHCPQEFKDMPFTLAKKIFNSDLVIFKGDLNYRRLIGDYKWEYTADYFELTKYINSPILIIRTIKSNLLVGCDQKQIKNLDFDILPFGKYGIIEFLKNV